MQGSEFLSPPIREIVSRYWIRLTEHPAYSEQLESLLRQDSGFRRELLRVMAASDFAANQILSRPELLLQLAARRLDRESNYQQRLRVELESLRGSDYGSDAEELKRRLRHFHRLEYLLVIWRDICELENVHEICARMSELADSALQTSLEILHHWSSREWGQPVADGDPQTMVILGMGKLGANELNVSSDIDLIFCFPQAGNVEAEPDATRQLTNQQFFTRLGQRLIDALDSVTAEGFLFRVDMRLRPYGGEGALVASFDAMEDYYQNQGRDWERYALIKARVVAGDFEQGQRLLDRLKPFVYRRYLDFAMFESLREMKSQINKQARRGKLATDIKLGPGGIREVEFTAQALQLVYGGRDKALRTPSLLNALTGLAAGNYLPGEVAEELIKSYEYLRKLEHKLQSFGNQQTQSLPILAEPQLRLAFAMGYDSWEELIDELDRNRRAVSRSFNDVLGTGEEKEKPRFQGEEWHAFWAQELSDDDAVALLEKAGFEESLQSMEQIRNFRNDKKFLTLPAASRERFNMFMPVLLDAVAESEHPSRCLSRVMLLVGAVSRRTAYLVLLLENPQALEQLVQYCTASPLIANNLSKYPILLDELLSVLDQPPEKATLAEELKLQLLRIDEENFEEEMDCLRYFKLSHHLQVAAAEVSGHMHLMKVSDYLTFTAEVILDAVLSLSWQHLTERYGFPVHTDGTYGKSCFGIIGYGKLGGIELSYSSDLDLVFIHQAALDKDTVVSEGQQSINSRAFYIKLAQRIILLLGTDTMSGRLYEADMRLRPSGESGLLVSSLDSFREYQEKQAWTWEHQALVRARGVAGNKELLERFKEVRAEILSVRRDRQSLADEVVEMREKMRKQLKPPTKSGSDKLSFQIKQGAGGIVDIEFLVQYLVLAYSADHQELFTYTDNFRILEAAGDCELLVDSDMAKLIAAYLELRAASHQIALQQVEDLDAINTLTHHQKAVVKVWNRVFGSAMAAD